ncbi:MAG: hypothetical protein KDM81_07665, partial [Verrucomicrobiae bacterium]|nr:hypothetical protein [Verrucomicrobiae bacterium]
GRVFVYDVESGRELVSPPIDGRARGCRFTRDGTRLAVLTYGGIQILASQIGSGERFQRLTIVDADHG